MRLVRRLGICVVATLLAAGCGGVVAQSDEATGNGLQSSPVAESSDGLGEARQLEQGEDPPPDAAAAAETTSGHLATRVRVQVSGDASFTWQGDQPLLVAENLSRKFLSVGADEVLYADNGQVFRFAFDLFGPYTGPGAYEISASDLRPSELDLSRPDLSNTFLHFGRLRDPDQPLSEGNLQFTWVFDRPEQPCTVEVGAGARAGSITCPQLVDPEGRAVTLTWTWQATD